MKNIIQVKNLTYHPESLSPDSPDILKNISLEIAPGSLVGIIGPNGSGKTTFLKHLNGLLTPTVGKVWIKDLDTKDPANWGKIRSLVGMVFQNPQDQIVASTVEEDIAFGLENANKRPNIIQKHVAHQLALADLTEEAKTPPHLLSGGQIQKLALAGVLARQPEVILFDEPTSMLDPESRLAFLARIKSLHQQGLTLFYVTQAMREVVDMDQLLVFHQGKIQMSGPPEEVFSHRDLLEEIGLEQPPALRVADTFRERGWHLPAGIPTQENLLAAIPEGTQEKQIIYSASREDTTPRPQSLIDIHKAEYTYLAGTHLAKKALHSVSLSINKGELRGLAGANGSGKSTLLQHINGLLRPDQGQIHVGPFQLENPAISIKSVVKQVGLVFQNPESQFFEQFVGDEIAFGPKQFGMEDIRQRVQCAMDQVGLSFIAYKDRRLNTLSGGEKRKVALASTLVLDQDILLFDEPTAGMDPKSRDAFLSLLKDLNQKGKTLLISTHQLDEILSTCQQFSLMSRGAVITTTDLRKTFPEQDKLRNAGLSQPISVRLLRRLQERGWVEGHPWPFSLDLLLRDLDRMKRR